MTDNLQRLDKRDQEQSRNLLQRETEKQVPVRVEKEPEPERGTEKPERKVLEAPEEKLVVKPVTPPKAIPSAAPQAKDALALEIENILSEDLGPIYKELSPTQQQDFKQEGERTASLIRQMIEQVKVKTKQILELIKRWLKLIPGVNMFFLEQEAKIKADKVMSLHQRIHQNKP